MRRLLTNAVNGTPPSAWGPPGCPPRAFSTKPPQSRSRAEGFRRRVVATHEPHPKPPNRCKNQNTKPVNTAHPRHQQNPQTSQSTLPNCSITKYEKPVNAAPPQPQQNPKKNPSPPQPQHQQNPQTTQSTLPNCSLTKYEAPVNAAPPQHRQNPKKNPVNAASLQP